MQMHYKRCKKLLEENNKSLNEGSKIHFYFIYSVHYIFIVQCVIVLFIIYFIFSNDKSKTLLQDSEINSPNVSIGLQGILEL